MPLKNPNVIWRSQSNVKTAILRTNGCNFRIIRHRIESRSNMSMRNFTENPNFPSKTDKSRLFLTYRQKNCISLIWQERSWFVSFWWKNRILRKILHRHVAPGFYQAIFNAKVTPICVQNCRFYIPLTLPNHIWIFQRHLESRPIIGFA